MSSLAMLVNSFLWYKTTIITIVFSYLFIFQADKLAAFVRLPDSNISIDKLSLELILRAGIILTGLYIFTTQIPLFITRVYNFQIKQSQVLYGISSDHGVELVGVFSCLVVIGLAAFFILQSQKIVKLIARFEK